MGKRVIITGGSGKAGRWIIKSLLQQGHAILNLDRLPLTNEPSVHTMNCDITDGGQVFSAFRSHFAPTEPLTAGPPTIPDAVIHLAAYRQPLLAPDSEVFRANVLGFHNVLEAACKLGVRKIILASSVCVYGVTYADGKRAFSSFPIVEDLDVNPTDPYALSKKVGETVARSFAERYGVDIYCLRIGRVLEPDEYDAWFPGYVYDAPAWDVHGWSYTDARDLGLLCHRALEVDGLRWQVFNATNDEITNLENTTEFLRRLYPSVPVTREMGHNEAPMSNRKARELLDFRPEYSWTKIFTAWEKPDDRPWGEGA